MTLPTHLMAGLIIGKLTGDYSVAIIGSVAPDVDHLASYARNGLLAKPRQFWMTITNRDDPYGDQRYFLHNVVVFACISSALLLANFKVGVVIGLAYFSHLLLDALDNSDYFPFFPSKKINLRGPINYLSNGEFGILLFLIIIYFLI